MDTHRNSENCVKCGVSSPNGFDGGLNYVKRWVAAVKGSGFSAFNGVGAALTKEM